MAEHKVYAVLLLTHHATKPLPVFFRAATILIFSRYQQTTSYVGFDSGLLFILQT